MRSLDSSATPRKGWLLATTRAQRPGSSRPGLACGDHRGGPDPARAVASIFCKCSSDAEYPLCFLETPEGLSDACLALPRRPRATRLKICIRASLGGAGGRLSTATRLICMRNSGAGRGGAVMGSCGLGCFYCNGVSPRRVSVTGFSVPSILSWPASPGFPVIRRPGLWDRGDQICRRYLSAPLTPCLFPVAGGSPGHGHPVCAGDEAAGPVQGANRHR